MTIYPKVWGGIGNQLFVYAMARALSLRTRARLLLNVDFFQDDKLFHRKLLLPDFQMSPATDRYHSSFWRWLTEWKNSFLIRVFCCHAFEGPTMNVRKLPLSWHGRLWIKGYWQSEKYFTDYAEEIYDDLQIVMKSVVAHSDIGRQIAEINDSVFLHVRSYREVKGCEDYHLALCDDYYDNAIRELLRRDLRPRIFVFSDDVEFARMHIQPIVAKHGLTATIVEPSEEGDDTIRDLCLMRMCRHAIVANSTFSWWGAWLGEQDNRRKNRAGFVLRPEGLAFPGANVDFYPDRWLSIPRYGSAGPFVPFSRELWQGIEDAYCRQENLLVEDSTLASDRKVCALYFSSNGLYYPKTFENFSQQVLERNRFEWYGTRVDMANRHVFVRDLLMEWYQKGISERLSSIQALQCALRDLTNGYDVICIGCSAGGYAALLFANLLNAKCCFAFSPCVNVRKSILRNRDVNTASEYWDARYDTLLKNDPETEYNDISSLVIDSRVKQYVFVPIKSAIDEPEYCFFKSVQNVKLLPYESSVHGIPFPRALVHWIINLDQESLSRLYDGVVCADTMSLLDKVGGIDRLVMIFKMARSQLKKKKCWFVRKKFYRNVISLVSGKTVMDAL